MAVAGAVTSFFILLVVLMYSAMVWRSLDQYFKEEFKKHLEQDKNYQRLQKDKLDIIKEKHSTEVKLDGQKFDEGILAVQKESCNREKMPADKYKHQEEKDEDYVDDGEVCPLLLPLSTNKNNGG